MLRAFADALLRVMWAVVLVASIPIAGAVFTCVFPFVLIRQGAQS